MAIFHSLHVGGPLRLWDRCCLQSFADHGHEIIVFGYERFDVPPGVRWAPAQEILPERLRAEYFAGRSAALQRFSDYFRYVLLNERDAFWVDTDVLCLSETVPDDDIVLAWENDTYVCGAIMRLRPGHPLLADAVEISRSQPDTGQWGDLGPHLLTRLIREHGLEADVAPAAEVYPLHWSAAFDFVDPNSCANVESLFAERQFAHLWHTIFRWAGIQTDFMPPAGSFLANAFARHGGAAVPSLDPKALAQQIRVVRERNAWKQKAQRLEAEVAKLKS